jgi:hypothetical protein
MSSVQQWPLWTAAKWAHIQKNFFKNPFIQCHKDGVWKTQKKRSNLQLKESRARASSKGCGGVQQNPTTNFSAFKLAVRGQPTNQVLWFVIKSTHYFCLEGFEEEGIVKKWKEKVYPLTSSRSREANNSLTVKLLNNYCCLIGNARESPSFNFLWKQSQYLHRIPTYISSVILLPLHLQLQRSIDVQPNTQTTHTYIHTSHHPNTI